MQPIGKTYNIMYNILSNCHKGCPCGQSLGQPIVQSKIDWSQRLDIFFVHILDLFCPVEILENDQFSKKDWTKNSREWTKKLSGLSDGTIFVWPTKKYEKLTRQLVSQRD